MEKPIKNILIPMNFSNSCDQAINIGIAMCKRHNATLHLLEVERERRFVFPTGRSAELLELRLESREKELKFMELYSAEVSADNGIHCFYHMTEGTFAKQVSEVADDFYCDLIILQQSFNESLYPSFSQITAAAIIKETSCPVMTLPKNTFSTDFKSIAFPIWATKAVLGKLEMSLPIIKKNNSRVILLSALKNSNDSWERNMVEKVTNTVFALFSFTTKEIKIDFDNSPGSAEQILRRSAVNGSDLIIINSNLKSGIKSVFVPTFADQIIRNSIVPVINVK